MTRLATPMPFTNGNLKFTLDAPVDGQRFDNLVSVVSRSARSKVINVVNALPRDPNAPPMVVTFDKKYGFDGKFIKLDVKLTVLETQTIYERLCEILEQAFGNSYRLVGAINGTNLVGDPLDLIMQLGRVAVGAALGMQRRTPPEYLDGIVGRASALKGFTGLLGAELDRGDGDKGAVLRMLSGDPLSDWDETASFGGRLLNRIKGDDDLLNTSFPRFPREYPPKG